MHIVNQIVGRKGFISHQNSVAGNAKHTSKQASGWQPAAVTHFAFSNCLGHLACDLLVKRFACLPIEKDFWQPDSAGKWFHELALSIVRQIGHDWSEEKTMITGGNATVFVSNMDNAVQFYTEVLGLRLTNRFGDHWATVDAGKGLTIGLHPASANHPAPGTKGGMMLGLEIGTSIEQAITRLTERRVKVGAIIRAPEGNFTHFEDPDGNPIYLWEVSQAVPESELVHSAGNSSADGVI